MSGSAPPVSAAALLGHIEALTRIGPRPDASAAEIEAREYVVARLERLGLRVERLPLEFPVVDDAAGRLVIDLPHRFEVAAVPHLRSAVGEVSAPLRFGGKLLARDLEAGGLEGAIALAFEDIPFEGEDRDGICYFGERVERAHRAGARGIVFADYRADSLITTWGIGAGIAPIPAVAIPYPELDRLRHLAVIGDVHGRLSVTGRVRPGTAETISATIPGAPGRGTVAIVGTHTDSVPTCATANDNASGLALLLELARVLVATPDIPSILLVVTTGEEAGSFGAKAFGDAHDRLIREELSAAIAFDQIGGTEAFLSAMGDRSLNDRLSTTADRLGFLLRRDDQLSPPRRTGLADVDPFASRGVPSAYIGGWTQDPVYHTSADLPGAVSPNALKALGDVIAATVAGEAGR